MSAPARAINSHAWGVNEWHLHATPAGWPESPDSTYLWREGGEPARQAYANVARAISEFEPLFMVANPGEPADNARKVPPVRWRLLNVVSARSPPRPWQGNRDCAGRPGMRGAACGASAQVFSDSPNVHVVECPINDGWTRDVSTPTTPPLCLRGSAPAMPLQTSSSALCS